MSMSAIGPCSALTRTSLIMNGVPRSRTVSPDLMSLALCSIIFILLLTIPSLLATPRKENQKQSQETDNPLNGECLDSWRHSIDTSTNLLDQLAPPARLAILFVNGRSSWPSLCSSNLRSTIGNFLI